MEAMIRYKNDSHAVEIARIQLHCTRSRLQDDLEMVRDALMGDEDRIAAGDQSSVARRDRRHQLLRQFLPRVERLNAKVHTELKRSEETAEASRDVFYRIRRG